MKCRLLIPCLFPLVACHKPGLGKPAAESPPPVAVHVQLAQSIPHLAVEEVVGTIRSKLQATVEAKISGRVLEYTAAPGSMVKSGDLLARLDVQEIQAKVDQARAMLDQARRDYERQRLLMSSNATTRQDFENAEARVKVTQAGMSEAETMMGYARVTAPFDGVITRKLADVGDLAMPGKPLLEIEAPTALRFEANLPEAILDRIKLGAKMQVKIASFAKPLEATVSEIAPVADPASRTFQVKLDLPAADGLRTGQFGRVSVPVDDTMMLLVPSEAVMKRGQMELVFVAKDGKAALRLVKTGKALDGAVEVLSGIENGEQVVTSNVATLADGQAVTIQP